MSYGRYWNKQLTPNKRLKELKLISN